MMSRDIHIHLKVSRRALVGGLVLLLLGALGYDAISETFTMISYYPSPMGMYKKLTTTSDTSLARDGGNVGIGTREPSQKLEVVGGVRVSQNAYVDGKLGVGTTEPSSKLDVRGDASFSKGVQVGNTNKKIAGAIRFTGDDFEGYDGTNWVSFTKAPGDDCFKSGGSYVSNQKLCYFQGSSCASGWVKSGNYTSTSATGCYGKARGSCSGTPCTTGSHLRQNRDQETCTWYYGYRPGGKGWSGKCTSSPRTCTAKIIEVGCKKN